MYFVVSSVVVLFLIGVFVFNSTTTYSIENTTGESDNTVIGNDTIAGDDDLNTNDDSINQNDDIDVNTGNTSYSEGDNVGGNELSGDDPQVVDDYNLISLSVNGDSISLVSGTTTYSYVLSSNTSEFRINATSNHSILISDDAGNVYSNNSSITWNKDLTQFSICVGDNLQAITDECKSRYILNIGRESAEVLTRYLETLSINSQDFDTSNSFVCDNTGDKLICQVSYQVPNGVNELNVSATTIDGYRFKSNKGPGIYSILNDIVLEIEDLSGTPSAIYYIYVNVPTNISSSPSVDSSSSIRNSSVDNNPGTGDMSSFIIFMIMLASLVASLIVYKRNVEN